MFEVIERLLVSLQIGTVKSTNGSGVMTMTKSPVWRVRGRRSAEGSEAVDVEEEEAGAEAEVEQEVCWKTGIETNVKC